MFAGSTGRMCSRGALFFPGILEMFVSTGNTTFKYVAEEYTIHSIREMRRTQW